MAEDGGFNAALRANIDWSSAEAATSSFLSSFDEQLKLIGSQAYGGGQEVIGQWLSELEIAVQRVSRTINTMFSKGTVSASQMLAPVKSIIENKTFQGRPAQYGFTDLSDKSAIQTGYAGASDTAQFNNRLSNIFGGNKNIVTLQEEVAFKLRAEADALAERLGIATRAVTLAAEGTRLDEDIIGLKAQVLVAEEERRNAEVLAANALRLQNGTLVEASSLATRQTVLLPQNQAPANLYQTTKNVGSIGEEETAAAGGRGLLGGFGSILPIIAGFTAYSQIRAAIKDAEDLEKVLALTKVQMDALGKGPEFTSFRENIIGISQATGSLNSETAQVAQQLQAAFGGDSTRALNETRSAMEAVKVTGLSISQVTNDFLALDKSFEGSGTTIEQLSDSALGLQQRFGTLAKDTIEFAAQLAPIAAEVGFTAKDLEAIGAAYQEFSGKPASAGAEQIGRVLAGIQDKAVSLVQFLQSSAPAVAQSVAASLGTGDVRGAFVTLLENYDKLNQQQQEQLLVTIAGRREAGTLSAVFADNAKLLDELNGKYDDSGKLQQTFTAVQKTLLQQIQQLGAEMKSVGLDFYNSGLKEFLTTLGKEVGVVIEAFDKFATVLGTVDHWTGGLAADIAALVFSLKALELLAGSQALTKLLGVVGVSSIGGQAVGAGAGGQSLGTAIGAGALLQRFNPITGIRAGVSAYGAARAGTAAVEGFGATGIGAEEAIAGAGIGESLLTGGGAALAAAGPGIILLGALAADKIVGHFSEGVQKAIDKNIRGDLGGKLTVDNPEDINKLLSGVNLGGTGIKNADQLSQYLSQVPSVLGTSPSGFLEEQIHGHASLVQQALDTGPGPARSQNIDEMRQRAHLVENAMAANVKSGLDTLQSNADVMVEFIKGLQASGGLEAAFGGQTSPDAIRNLTEGLIQSLDKAGGDYTKLSADDQRKYAQLYPLFQPGGAYAQAGARVAQKMKEQADAASQSEVDIEDASTAKADFQAGLISLNQYVSRLASAQKALDALAADNDPKHVKAAQQGHQELAKVTSDALRQQADLLVDSGNISGQGTPASTVTILSDLLNNPQFTDKGDRLKATKDLVTAIRAEKDFEASLTNDAIQKAAILNTATALPEGAQEALITEFLGTSLAFQQWLAKDLSGYTDVQEQLTGIIAQQIATGTKDVKEATKQGIQIELTLLAKQYNQLNSLSPYIRDQALADKIFNEIIALNNEYAHLLTDDSGPGVTVPGFDTTASDAAKKKAADDAARQERRAIANSNLDKLVALNDNNAIQLAKIAVQRADTELAFAQEGGVASEIAAAEAKQLDAQNVLRRAYVDYRKAIRQYSVVVENNNDPLAKAFSDADQAQDDLAQITDTTSTEYVKALTAKAEADRAVIKSFLDYADALDNLDVSKEFGGDPVGAAQKKLQDLQRRLDNAAGLGLGATDIVNLQTEINNQIATVAEAQISQGEKQIQTALDLGRINKGQAIAQLQALKVFAKTQQEIDDIDLEIKRLRDALGQDFQFNLPAVLGLPTLYQANRVGQTPGGGGAYQDNRNVVVNINATTNATAEQIGAAVAPYIGNPQARSTQPRRYT